MNLEKLLKELFMNTKHICILFIICLSPFFCQSAEEPFTINLGNAQVNGFLNIPEKVNKAPLIILVSGTHFFEKDLEGLGFEDNSFRQISEYLYKNGIACYRIEPSSLNIGSDIDIKFENYATTLKTCVDTFYLSKRFSKIIVAGTNDGALMGILTAIKNPKVNGFVSLAGYGRVGDEVLKEKLSGPNELNNKVIYDFIDLLKKGDTLPDLPRSYLSVFKPSIQPFLISWFKINPANELKKTTCPVLIFNGTTDLKVKTKDYQLLCAAKPLAQKKVIKNMNHNFTNCDKLDRESQIKFCTNSSETMNKDFLLTLVNFIKTVPKALKN